MNFFETAKPAAIVVVFAGFYVMSVAQISGLFALVGGVVGGGYGLGKALSKDSGCLNYSRNRREQLSDAPTLIKALESASYASDYASCELINVLHSTIVHTQNGMNEAADFSFNLFLITPVEMFVLSPYKSIQGMFQQKIEQKDQDAPVCTQRLRH